jgi:hypothetical protein
MPEQMPAHAQELQRLGLTVDPKLLSDPLSGLLGAVVRLSGCSASFISADGLIATNHHCASGALQYNSTAAKNLLHDGFLARDRAGELSAGPTARVQITRAFREVTGEVRAALDSAQDDLARQKAFEKFEKEAVAACEKDRPELRCELKPFYVGLRFFMIEQLELRDVRLVYAPPAGIGNFGGEVDNWRWPRHTGDFTFFRAYVGKDGKPADFNAENVVYRPAQHLELATRPLNEGDLVIVTGYPGRTSTFALARELQDTIEWLYPRRLAMFEAFLARVEEIRSTNPDARIKGTGLVRRFNNFRTKHQGELEGIARGRLLELRRAQEAELKAYIRATPERLARYGGAIEAIEQALDQRRLTREADTALQVELLQPQLLWAATLIVRMAEERQKPDAERDPDYQQRKVHDLRDQLTALDKSYHPLLDRALLRLALERIASTPMDQRSPALGLLVGADVTAASIERTVAKLYAGTQLFDVKQRLALFEKATPATLARSKDALIRAAVQLRPLLRAAEERRDRYTGVLLQQGPRYAAAQLEKKGGYVAPDANGTLRVSYGVVHAPPSGGPALTRVSELVSKNQGKEPFEVPEALLAAVREQRFGPYASGDQRGVPVNFLADVPISNGNSGSATLDREGKLTGLAFDGTYESVATDFGYQSATRSIHVDSRYLLWVLDAVEKADSLLAELGLRPQTPR